MINCIVAVERNQGIGFEGQMPWPRLVGDMRWFKEKTTDQIVIMGRKTWESIGSKNLPNRINIVISRNSIEGVDQCFSDTDRALDFCTTFYPHKEIFIIGGSAVYQHYLDIVDRFYVTEIDSDYKCDTFFDLDYVQETFTKVKEHATFNEPIKYTIKEYNI
jgi:dihydrofolate reductase